MMFIKNPNLGAGRVPARSAADTVGRTGDSIAALFHFLTAEVHHPCESEVTLRLAREMANGHEHCGNAGQTDGAAS